MAQALSGRMFMIMNVGSKTVLDFSGEAGQLNAVVGVTAQLPLAGGPLPRQYWMINSSGNSGYFTIGNVFHPNVLTLKDGDSTDGTPVQLVPGYATDRQLWSITEADPAGQPRYYRFINKASNTALDLYNSNPADGTPVQGWAQTDNNPHQGYVLIEVFP